MNNERLLDASTRYGSTRKQSTITNLGLKKALAVGAFLGLTWGASLRAWMVILALEFGDYPRFTWNGTFLMILLPSVLMGGLISGAHYALVRNGNRLWRWASLAPLLLVLAPLIFMEDFIPMLLADGLGGGAIAVALIGLFGGYGLSSHRKSWLRGLALFLAVILTVATPLAVFFADQAGVSIPSERQAFGVLYFVILMILLMKASSIPYEYNGAIVVQKLPTD